MRSGVVHLEPGPWAGERLLAGAAEIADSAPDVVLAFLPPDEGLHARLELLAATWPQSTLVGCEAVTQFAGARATGDGTLQLLWLERPGHGVRVLALACDQRGEPADGLDGAVSRAAAHLADCSAALILADGTCFPSERFLGRLQQTMAEELPPIAGGLASAEPGPLDGSRGARIFHGRTVLRGGALVVALDGIEMRVEVVRGWSPASPIYTVTAADGPVLWQIDEEPATDWFRRFFTVDGELAPMPETCYGFPLIVDGLRPERRNLYRTVRAFDEPPGAVTFWGELEPGDRVRLGMGNEASLVATAERLSAGRPGAVPEAAVLYSCVGREAVLGERAEREVAAIHRLLDGVSLAGFFTFGEIGPVATDGVAFYNQTAILALLTERSAGETP